MKDVAEYEAEINRLQLIIQEKHEALISYEINELASLNAEIERRDLKIKELIDTLESFSNHLDSIAVESTFLDICKKALKQTIAKYKSELNDLKGGQQ